MKLGLLLLLTMLSLSGRLLAKDIERDELMWATAYKGDLFIVHRLAITRQAEDINDDLLSQFAMAYVYYKMGRYEEIEAVFSGVDSYIEHVLIQKQR